MSKRRRGARDWRPNRDDDSRPFAASGGDADSSVVPLGGLGVERGPSAGQMLRAMREAAGVDAALVASALKVTPQKIDALEAERYSELPDLTFARGLAAAFCRAFGEDPAPVLARMPSAAPTLHATGNANQPMQGGSGMGSEISPVVFPRPLLWAVGALLLAALVIWLLPPRPDAGTTEPLPAPAPVITQPEHTVQLPPALAASTAEVVEAAASVASAASEAASAAPQPASAASSQAAASGKLLGFEALEEVWVEVVDANERVLVTRTIAKGQRVNVDEGALPLSVKVGRRDAVRVTVRGKPYDLPKTGNGGAVARFQVK